MKTEIEKMIEEQYQNCHIPVLCKNKTYADAATGRKADPKIAEEEGKVKFISASMQYVNQKLDKPIYHEFIWIENRIIHHKVICAFRINKHGMDWKDVYHAKFYTESTCADIEGEGTLEYWLSDESDSLFVEDTHNWIGHEGSEVVDVENCNEGDRNAEITANDTDRSTSTNSLDIIPPNCKRVSVYDLEIDISYYSSSSSYNYLFKNPRRQKAALRKWINGDYKKILDNFNRYRGLKARRFGCEIEFTGISRDTAARVIARVFDTEKVYKGGVYNEHHIVDHKNRTWRIVRDASIFPSVTANRQNPNYGHYMCELVTPILEYKDMYILKEIVDSLRIKGAVVNTSCGMHVHVDVRNITAVQLRNIVNITACREDLLCKALAVAPSRLSRWCRKIDTEFAHSINGLSRNVLTIQAIKNAWYKSTGYPLGHYNRTRYHILNLHSFFEGKGIEFRLFNSTLESDEVKANIILALGICCTGCYQKKTRSYNVLRYVNIEALDKKDMTSFMNQLGIVGDEFKTVRFNLVKNMNKGRMVA